MSTMLLKGSPQDPVGTAPQPGGVDRLGTAAAWISAVCCLPYLVLKVLWAFDVPVGITDHSLLHSKGWVAENAAMAVVQLTGLLLVLALTRPWARRVPGWLLLVPAWVGTGLLFQIAVGALLTVFFSSTSHAASAGTGGIQPWVYVLVYASFAGQGAALAIAFACYIRARWSAPLDVRTGDVIARRTARVRSWPEKHLAQLAVTVAGLAVAMAVVCGYWAAGGSSGPSGALPDPPSAMQASRLAGAVTAVAGLLALAGRWGRGRRLWLPAALTWLGSGAMVAFDALVLVLFVVFRPEGAEAGWSLTDTLVAVKVIVGVLAAAVGVLAVTAAAKDQEFDWDVQAS